MGEPKIIKKGKGNITHCPKCKVRLEFNTEENGIDTTDWELWCPKCDRCFIVTYKAVAWREVKWE